MMMVKDSLLLSAPIVKRFQVKKNPILGQIMTIFENK